MSKTLKVINPFFTLNAGDVLEFSEEENVYKYEHDEQFNRSGANGETFNSSYCGTFKISPDYAKELIGEGYLTEEVDTSQKFVNVFEEIDNLLDKYVVELKKVENDEDAVPACLRVEKTTVLQNLIKVLTHLKSLKK